MCWLLTKNVWSQTAGVIYESHCQTHTHDCIVVRKWMWLSSQCFLGWGPWIIDPVSTWALLMDHFLIFPLVWVPLDQNWGWVLLGSLRTGWCVWSWLQMAAAQQNIPSHFPLSVTPDATQKLLRASRFSTCVCMSCLLCLFVWVTSVLSRVVFHIYLYGFIACREYMKEDKEGLYLCVFDQVKGAILWILYIFSCFVFVVIFNFYYHFPSVLSKCSPCCISIFCFAIKMIFCNGNNFYSIILIAFKSIDLNFYLFIYLDKCNCATINGISPWYNNFLN